VAQVQQWCSGAGGLGIASTNGDLLGEGTASKAGGLLDLKKSVPFPYKRRRSLFITAAPSLHFFLF